MALGGRSKLLVVLWSSDNRKDLRKEIYKVYATNLGPDTEHVVMKTAKTISFIPQYPKRRIQIVLKLPHSPLENLLRVDLDACAMGFDGTRVFMLPRCARAIETGYSVFTMDLIWGHRLGNRRETQMHRVFKYANRGFGLRILSSYVRSLEKRSATGVALSDQGTFQTNGAKVLGGPTRIFQNEPGLKTLRRIARLAQDFVYRMHFGPSKRIELDEDKGFRGRIWLSDLNGTNMTTGIPDARNSIGVFELFMRHCAAWRLDAIGLACFDEAHPEALEYDLLEIYDGLPTYKWSASTTQSMEGFKTNANNYNRYLLWTLEEAMTEKSPPIGRWQRLTFYLTRRVRRLIAGDNMVFVQAREFNMPLIIPMALQKFITEELSYHYGDLSANALSEILIPVYDPSRYDATTATLPSLPDTVSDGGNIRYWLITNQSMWAGQHRVLDEVAELLSMLFNWFTRDRPYMLRPHFSRQPRFGTDDPQCIWYIADFFRRRLILPTTSNTLQRDDTLSERETRLFRAWALTRPPRAVSKHYPYEDMEKIEDGLEKEGDIADKLFWEDGDEGTWDDEEGVPMWRHFDDIFDLRNLSL